MGQDPLHFIKSSLKTLTAVEAEPSRSNQHEFQGVSSLRAIFERERISTTAEFILRNSNLKTTAGITWYDARENNPERAPEYRLYFVDNAVMRQARAGDNILLGVTTEGDIKIVLIQANTQGHTGSVNQWTQV